MRFICFFLFLVIFNSCSNYEAKKIYIDDRATSSNLLMLTVNKEYDSLKSFFNTKFIDHFPKKLDTFCLGYTGSIKENNDLIRLEVTYKYDKENFQKFVRNIHYHWLAVYQSVDSCLLIPQRYITKENYFNQEINFDSILKKTTNCDTYPVPNFWSNPFLTNYTNTKLSKDFVIYILEAKSGRFLEKSMLVKTNLLPKKWEHGFSRGLAISSEQYAVIFWVIIW